MNKQPPNPEMMPERPRLRALDFQPVLHRGEQMWLLRDPLGLSERQLILPPALAQILLFCDGEHDLPAIQRAVSAHLGFNLPYDTVAYALRQLDETFLLENERSRAAQAALLADYRAAPHRPAALAGLSYAAEPAALRAQLDGYVNGAPAGTWQGRALISPHIDYQRGGHVYGQVWSAAAAAVRAADLVLMFGTDHNGGLGSVTLTRQPYATPFGVIPTDVALVDELAAAVGPDFAYELEINHRQEHSIELSAVWLHHMAGAKPPPMVPVLVGSFHHFVTNGGHPSEDERLMAFVETLRRATTGRRVLAVASVDLAHVGPNFGDDYLMDDTRRQTLADSDARLMAAIGAGDAERFYGEIAAVADRNRICGFSSTYLMLRYLGAVGGTTVAYDQCSADPQDTSFVSICGMLLT